MKIKKVLFLRRGLGISQSLFANRLGISRATLSKKELGEIDFTQSEMNVATEIFKQLIPDITRDKIFFDIDLTI